jgi:glutamine amidotransferase
LFACLRQLLLDDATLDLPGAILLLFSLLADMVTSQAALLNIIITDGVNLYAARHGINHECPSLYYTTADELFPGGQVIASERFSDDRSWQPVPEHHLLIISPGKPPELLAL